ncbi:MAG: 4Fe-4S binding protein [Thermodesulfovibrionales bacterium]|nr:4Fe-4S binding protein [Thermodesulfovibrionales bacterium]
MKINTLRRVFLSLIILLFLLQFLRIKILVGSLSGSVLIWSLNLIDVFAFLESLVATKDFSEKAILSVFPLILLYTIFGRSFCGWVCPMDYIFEQINKINKKQKNILKPSKQIGYILVFCFLIVSFFLEVPFFTNYLSHLTNFFRILSVSILGVLKFPVDISVLYFSLTALFLLIGVEFFFPRLWCKSLCPLGKIYGVFNKVSIIKLKIAESKCSRCGICDKSCYMSVKISDSNKPVIRDTNCIYCGRCVDKCTEKIIKIRFGV